MIINNSYHDFDEETAEIGKGTIAKVAHYWLKVIMRGDGGITEVSLHGMTPQRMLALADKIREATLPYIEATTPTSP